jgi:hypothetical protein
MNRSKKRFSVMTVERPTDWRPGDWSDLPKAPFRVVSEEPEFYTRAEAEGFCFGFNCESFDKHGALWAISVRLMAIQESPAPQMIGDAT